MYAALINVLFVLAANEPLAPAAGPRLDAAFVEVQMRSENDLGWLAVSGFNVTNVQGSVVTIQATVNEIATLNEAGFATIPVPQDMPQGKGLDGYDDYASLTAKLEGFAAEHPDIARLSTLGQSVQGRELWALLITDNPGVEEDEPEFKYVSTIHGDEPVGTELCLYLIERLLGDYGADARITNLVDDTAIWIVPLMNPDGIELNQRGNAQGFDLNRSFPSYPVDFEGTLFDDEVLDTEGRPAEVVHVMNWTVANSFALSANLHTGALLVNYPYDYVPGIPSGSPAISPDEDLFRDLSLRYSATNLPMFNSPAFEFGIVNGSDWYSITGGMQDWNYRYAGVPEVTIELSDVKRPSGDQLDQFWQDNEESMLSYIEAVHVGLRGIVTDRMTGQPLFAEVLIAGNEQPVFTDLDVGDYHRLLLPGEYGVTIHAAGLISRREVVQVLEGSAARLDAALSDGDINADGRVDAADVQLVINAILAIQAVSGADVDGGGLAATDLQAVVNQALSAPPNRR